MANLPGTYGISANFKLARLLVVEANDDHWLLIQRAMGQVLPEVRPVRAASPLQARALLTAWAQDAWEGAMPKLVLLELCLPRREQGWQVLAAIKRLPSPCNLLPVVVLSCSSDQLDINEAYRRGCASYLIKPLLFADWLDCVKQLRLYWWETVTLPVTRLPSLV